MRIRALAKPTWAHRDDYNIYCSLSYFTRWGEKKRRQELDKLFGNFVFRRFKIRDSQRWKFGWEFAHQTITNVRIVRIKFSSTRYHARHSTLNHASHSSTTEEPTSQGAPGIETLPNPKSNATSDVDHALCLNDAWQIYDRPISSMQFY